ncbi:MAG: hypothetical protein HQL53_05415 [Magnetococcales bacterium]|nr:hypothetical protein [Magnetococcales bacterium]
MSSGGFLCILAAFSAFDRVLGEVVVAILQRIAKIGGVWPFKAGEIPQSVSDGKGTHAVRSLRNRTVSESSSRSGIWSNEAFRVSLSERVRRIDQGVQRAAEGLSALIEQARLGATRLYVSFGGWSKPLEEPVVTRTKPVELSRHRNPNIWPDASFRVDISDAGRLVDGVMRHMDAPPDAQQVYLRKLQQGVQSGHLPETSIEEARSVLRGQGVLPPSEPA